MNKLSTIAHMYWLVILFLFAVLYMPSAVYGTHGGIHSPAPTGIRNPGAGGSIKLENPLAFNSIGEFVAGALQALVVIALPIVGFFILLSGFLFISARGNKDQLAKAKTNFMWVIAGAILILGAWALAQLIEGTVNQLRA